MKTHLIFLCIFLALVAPGLADPTILESPDKSRTWAQADEVARQFVWDAKERKFGFFLTYTNIDDASRVDAPQTETLSFSFPGVTWDAGQKLFILVLPDGKTVPVARKVTRLFVMSQIELLPRNHVIVRSPDGEVRVSLELLP